jgi:hypothetical protein
MVGNEHMSVTSPYSLLSVLFVLVYLSLPLVGSIRSILVLRIIFAYRSIHLSSLLA